MSFFDKAFRHKNIVCLKDMSLYLFPVSKDTQEIEEEVDEVEVYCQAAHKCHLLCLFCAVNICRFCQHDSDALNIVGSKSDKYHDTEIVENHCKSAARDKDVHHCGYNQADKSHNQDSAHGGEVFFHEQTYKRHRPECPGADEKCLCNACQGIEEEYHRHRDAIQNSVSGKA